MRTTKATIIYLGDEDEIIVETETHSVRIGCYRDPIPTEDNPSYSLRIECPQGFDENELVKQADESTWQLEDAYHTTNRSWIFPH